MPVKHIIFDCDGVLVDSEPLSMRIDVQILAEAGVKMSEEEAHARFVGKTFQAMIDEVSREYGVSFPADASADKDRRLLAVYKKELKPVEGLIDALEAIGQKNFGVASNSPEERVRAALAITGLTSWFTGPITTFEHVKHGKPEPDIYVEAAKRVGATPASCLVIEDSITGVTSARRAGCQILGFVGVHPSRETQSIALLQAGAALTFSDMRALPNLLENYLLGRKQAH